MDACVYLRYGRRYSRWPLASFFLQGIVRKHPMPLFSVLVRISSNKFDLTVLETLVRHKKLFMLSLNHFFGKSLTYS